MSFTDRVVKSRDKLVRLVTGKSNGRDAWWYVRIRPEMLKTYKLAVKSDSIDIAEYGEVLTRGWGKEPPEEIKKKIEEEY